MTKVYDQHDAAFRSVSAFVVIDPASGKPVAKVAFKFGGAVTAYVHWIGIEMTRGQAGGGGYDRQSAAVAAAARKIPDDATPDNRDGMFNARAKILEAARADGGKHWDGALRDAGFVVIQAV